MAKDHKTLAMRVLDGKSINYEVVEFPDSIHDALGVAEYTGLPSQTVYKTLVARVLDPTTAVPLKSSKPVLILVPAGRSLDLKKVAARLGVKKVAMARQADAERLTGLKVGGISALALLNRGFQIYVDEQAILLECIVVSAGERGLNLRLKVDDLLAVTGAGFLDASQPDDSPDGAAA
jgi:Cys-tRNA(Pro)/Cys-tRNA(Cys) deacylase